MADFGDPNTALAQFAQKLRDKAAGQAPQEPVPPVNIDTPPSTPPTPPVAEPVAPAAVEPVVQPVAAADPTPPTEPVTPTVEEPKWDDGIFSQPPSQDEPLTLDAISSALKLEGVKSKDDLVAAFTNQQTKIKELETQSQSQFEGLDEEFREVFRIAKEKGDWKNYLSTAVVDYTNVDPVQLFEREIDKHFTKDGVYDKDGADAASAEIPPAYKKIQGEMIKQNLIERQNARRQEIKRQQEEKRQAFGRGVAEATKNLGQTLPQDKYGIVFEPKHGDLIYNGIRDGSLVKKHFGAAFDVTSVDPSKLVKVVALAEWGEKISKFRFDQGKVKGMKEVLNKAQNVQLNTPAIPPNPGQPNTAPKSAADKIRESQAPFRQPNSL